LLAGLDPVAVDATGARIIQAKRRNISAKSRSTRRPSTSSWPTRHHLGTANPAKIDLVRSAGPEGILI
jgi:hypothetical protein